MHTLLTICVTLPSIFGCDRIRIPEQAVAKLLSK